MIIFLSTFKKFEIYSSLRSLIVFKFFSLAAYKLNINWNLTLSVYYFANLFFLLLILAFFNKNFKNYIFLISFLLIYSFAGFVYQSYVDPLFFLLVFCYFNFVDQIKIINVKYIVTYFLFYFFMLFGSIFYRSVCSMYFPKVACLIQ